MPFDKELADDKVKFRHESSGETWSLEFGSRCRPQGST